MDDHEVVRIGLRTLIERDPSLEVVAEAGTAAEAVDLALRLDPDVVLMDIRLPDRSGIEACAEITRARPDVRVVVLTSYAEDELLVDAIAAGASGYVLKQAGGAGILEAIREVATGRLPLDSSLTAGLFARVRQSVDQGRREAFAGLGDQELRILSLLAKGKTNRQIGGHLGLREGTVRNYVSEILSKLNLASRAEAAAYGVKHRVEDALAARG